MSLSLEPSARLASALLIARLCLGFMFFLLGWYKVFEMGPSAHAELVFVQPYADTFLPAWLLRAGGFAIPFIELLAGALLLVGLWRLPALLTLGTLLVSVTFGHMLADAFYEFHSHVLPRLVLLLFILVLPAAADRYSLDEWRVSGADVSANN